MRFSIKILKKLKDNNIKFLTHLIFGLPKESYDDMISSRNM